MIALLGHGPLAQLVHALLELLLRDLVLADHGHVGVGPRAEIRLDAEERDSENANAQNDDRRPSV
jgi:hypothetical protein